MSQQSRLRCIVLAAFACCMAGAATYAVQVPEHGHHEKLAVLHGELVPADLTGDVVVTPAAVGPKLYFDPPEAPPGTPVRLVFEPPASERVVIKWGEQKFGKIPAPEANQWLVWPVPGENVASVKVLWTVGADGIEERGITAKHISGTPPPDPPLSTLVTKEQAGTLSAWYESQLSAVPYIESPARWEAVHAAKISTLTLAGSTYAEVVGKRFAKLVTSDLEAYKSALVDELGAVVKELGVPPGPGPVQPTPVDPNTTVTSATYVYEKDDTAIPVGVSTALNRLNRERNIRATLFEDDTVDGDGDVPDQYKVALQAAVQAGLPAFVVQAGDKVLTVVKAPATEQQILEAVR